MAKLDPQRLVFGLFLLVLIIAGEVIITHLGFPTWPAFMIMIFFFMEHMNIKKAPHMLAGGLFGIACIILIGIFVKALAPLLGTELSIIIFICIFVYAIVAFGEMLPIVLNNYAFMFFTISALAVKTADPNPYLWMGVEILGGGLFIAGIIGIIKLLGILAKKKAATAG